MVGSARHTAGHRSFDDDGEAATPFRGTDEDRAAAPTVHFRAKLDIVTLFSNMGLVLSACASGVTTCTQEQSR